MGYARILLAFWGLAVSISHPALASWIWLGSASLDLFDGMVARCLNQCSQLGVLLDIAADNLLRTSFWMAAVVASASWHVGDGQGNHVIATLLVATFIVSLEWITMVCTQLHATTAGDHWKQCRGYDPWWIQAIFANNFKTPLGVLCIGGLFGSGFMTYAQTKSELVSAIPWFYVLRNLSFAGRCITMVAELWLCGGYLSHVIAKDEERGGIESERMKSR
jgi:phosphatidylglycerophosphate synthase